MMIVDNLIALTPALMALAFILWSGALFQQKKMWGGTFSLLFGILVLAISFSVIGAVQYERGFGIIATDLRTNALKTNTPYLVKSATRVPFVGNQVVFLCEVYKDGRPERFEEGDTNPRITHPDELGCADSVNWQAYRFYDPVPPVFIKTTSGAYKEVTLQDAKLLRDTAR
ncbi:MAG: hypothetical protein HYY92_00245 [Parcubacteria group bacterium]|nr:hypothetical protein [Parcubacteria group bacterium]